MIEFDTQIIPTARAMSFLFSGRVQLSKCAKNFTLPLRHARAAVGGRPGHGVREGGAPHHARRGAGGRVRQGEGEVQLVQGRDIRCAREPGQPPLPGRGAQRAYLAIGKSTCQSVDAYLTTHSQAPQQGGCVTVYAIRKRYHHV